MFKSFDEIPNGYDIEINFASTVMRRRHPEISLKAYLSRLNSNIWQDLRHTLETNC